MFRNIVRDVALKKKKGGAHEEEMLGTLKRCEAVCNYHVKGRMIEVS
jgi:hypothetical protein